MKGKLSFANQEGAFRSFKAEKTPDYGFDWLIKTDKDICRTSRRDFSNLPF